jgi:hypothetical protein
VARKAFLLRISPKLYEELQEWADAELRSVNGQIEYLLRRAVAERKSAAKAAPPKPLPTAQSQPPREPPDNLE